MVHFDIAATAELGKPSLLGHSETLTEQSGHLAFSFILFPPNGLEED